MLPRYWNSDKNNYHKLIENIYEIQCEIELVDPDYFEETERDKENFEK